MLGGRGGGGASPNCSALHTQCHRELRRHFHHFHDVTRQASPAARTARLLLRPNHPRAPSPFLPQADQQRWRPRRRPLSWTSRLRRTSPQLAPFSTLTAHSGTGYSKLGFAGNDSPSFVFPTAIATKGPTGGAGGSGSGRPAVANKPSFLTGGAGPSGHLSGKRGTEDLDFFIGDEALTASAGPGTFAR